MKKIVLFVILVLPAFIVKGQYPPVKNIGDSIQWTTISFDEPTPYITLVPQPQNIWQIGAPHKTFFNTAFSVPNAIVTDTSSYYPANNFSSFELVVGNFNTQSYMYDSFIDFRHKFDTDTLSDGGYITVSWDNGLTWTNIINDSTSLYQVTPGRDWYYFGNTTLYDTTSHLAGGEHGFSGHSDGWLHSCMAWYYIPEKQTRDILPDTMRLRFNFISAGIQNNHEGWMIDQIRLFSVDLGSGIRDFMEGNSHSWFFPNPVTSTATFTMNKTHRDVRFELMDSRGVVILTGRYGTCDEFIFDRKSIPPGIYFMRLSMDNQLTDFHKIVIAE